MQCSLTLQEGVTMRRTQLSLVLLAALSLITPRALANAVQSNISADEFPSEVASSWFELLYDVVKAERTTPPPASRIYGISAVALYESIVSGTEENRSLVGQLNGLVALPQANKKNLHWPTVANTVLANTIRGLFTNISALSSYNIKTLEINFANRYQQSVPRPQYERSV